MMKTLSGILLLLLLILLQLLVLTMGASQTGDHKEEAHRIMRRMAEWDQSFEGHDVARVHLVEGQGEGQEQGQPPGRRLAKRDLRHVMTMSRMNGYGEDVGERRAIQLALASGSTVGLSLRPASVVDRRTVVSFRTARRKLEGSLAHVDCYSRGLVQDSSGEGWAAISHCDGLFGFANSGGYEYFLHPVESKTDSKRWKRDTTGNDDDYDVHVMWRRSASNEQMTSGNEAESTASSEEGNEGKKEEDEEEYGDNYYYSDAPHRVRREAVDKANATGFVIEMALFSDQRYWEQLTYLYPGREDDYMLTKLAGVQGLYSNREKVGYDVRIHVKLLEYWQVDPDEYVFAESYPSNLRSFCGYTTKKYFYDVHALHTGIVKWNKGQTGLANVGGTCTGSRCMVVKGLDLDSFKVFAHELGHMLGMSHTSACPKDLRSEGGFMGGNSPYNFSPCMKRQLGKFIATSKSNCLFKTSGENTTLEEFSALPSLLPGQVRSPDGLCQLLAGPDFRYVPNERPPGNAVCRWFLCLNDNETSVDFRRARFYAGQVGVPCKEEAFCDIDKSCKEWDQVKMALQPDVLRSLTEPPEWSEWSTEVSRCSRSCGSGLRTRRRECRYPGHNLSPYCPGMSLKPEVCNTQPCPGDTEMTQSEVRAAKGDEVCARFLREGVRLRLKKAAGYFPTSAEVTYSDVGTNLAVFDSGSCLIKCEREPKDANGDLDAVLPDGTPCLENKRTKYDMDRLGIEMQCVGGHCLEVSDCPGDILQPKDDCGVCGGDGSRCVKLEIDRTFNVPRKQRNLVATIPPCSRNVDVRADPRRNTGVVLELWSSDDRNIIGDGGLYPWMSNHEDVEFAGANWSYVHKEGYLRASGPLMEPVQIKFLRLGTPLNVITINYANSA